MKRIYLIGFMGCGKSFIGKRLAKSLDYKWVDLDALIVERQGCSIAQIFKEHGEAYFRELETALLVESRQWDEVVISTGGGVIMAAENRSLLKQEKALYLEWKPQTLLKRIAQDKERPLAGDLDQLKALYEWRAPLYEEVACQKIDCEKLSPQMLVMEIIKRMEETHENSCY